MPPRNFTPLNHFDYGLLDKDCFCEVCEDWRTSLTAYNLTLTKVAEHSRDCECEECRLKFKYRSAYLSAMNRRDLYCEASFHAYHEPELGTTFMDFMKTQVVESDRMTRGWWEMRAPGLPLYRWFSMFQTVRSLMTTGFAVSGAAA